MGEDVSDGKSSRPWAMHGKPPGRPARRLNIPHSCPLPSPTRSQAQPIDHWSIFKEGLGISRRLALIPYLERRFVVDFTLRKGRALGASKPTVSGIGFYLHKDFGAAEVGILSKRECRAAEIWILSTQRIPRGRGPMLISTNVLWDFGLIRS